MNRVLHVPTIVRPAAGETECRGDAPRLPTLRGPCAQTAARPMTEDFRYG